MDMKFGPNDSGTVAAMRGAPRVVHSARTAAQQDFVNPASGIDSATAAAVLEQLGQSLHAIKVSLESCAALLARAEAAHAAEVLDKAIARTTGALADVREICGPAHATSVETVEILPALGSLIGALQASCEGLSVDTAINVAEADIPAPLRVTLYAILHEALRNIAEHAHASRVRVRMDRVGDVLHLLVQDNGCGFDARDIELRAQVGGERREGLSMMQERAALSGGTYQLKSSPGHGTAIWMSWPCG